MFSVTVVILAMMALSSCDATILLADGRGCKSQVKNFGPQGSVDACAAATAKDADCVSNTFMFAPVYDYSWGCRCCDETVGGDANSNWDLYAAGSPIKVVDGQGCGSQAKNFGPQGSPEACATATLAEPGCAENTFMFAPVYDYSWGCRCCSKAEGGDANNNWDLYLANPLVKSFPGQGCGSQTKNLGPMGTAEACAVAAMTDPECAAASNGFMFAPVYDYSWGCRCCSDVAGGGANANWDTYQYAAAVAASGRSGRSGNPGETLAGPLNDENEIKNKFKDDHNDKAPDAALRNAELALLRVAKYLCFALIGLAVVCMAAACKRAQLLCCCRNKKGGGVVAYNYQQTALTESAQSADNTGDEQRSMRV